MSNVYIRSQNREKLYIFGISFNSLQYEEQHDYKRGKEAATHHTICIADGCLEEIAEYESKERCIEVLDEIEKVCGSLIPCICWNETADEVANWLPGDTVKLIGRLQSREYEKLIEELYADGVVAERVTETRTAYEVSVHTIKKEEVKNEC